MAIEGPTACSWPPTTSRWSRVREATTHPGLCFLSLFACIRGSEQHVEIEPVPPVIIPEENAVLRIGNIVVYRQRVEMIR